MKTIKDIENEYASKTPEEINKILWVKGQEVDKLREIYKKARDADNPENYYEIADAKRQFEKAYKEYKAIGNLIGHKL